MIGATSLQAQEIDLLITGGIVVTMDANWQVFEEGTVAIDGGRVVEVGPASDIAARGYDASDVIDASGGVILPGLVNAHTHVPMVLFRGLADDLELDEWLRDYIFPVEARHVTRDFVAAGTRLALAEMIGGGTTTFCDMYYFEDAIAEETAAAGMRAILGETVLDFPAPDNKTWEAALSDVERFVDKWDDHTLITPAIAPHASYTVSTEHLGEAQSLAERLDIPLVMHIAEAPGETEYTLEHFGARPVRYLDQAGFLSERLIGAHVVHVDAEEVDLLGRRGVGIAHCPSSNMKLASGVAPIPRMLESGLRVGLGSDGAASNNDLNMWEEMDTAAKLHKIVSGNPTVVSARQALEMGTIGGARALHLEDEIGSLEVGKQADVIIVDLGASHMAPMYDVYSHLVYAAKASDVTHTIVAGQILMRDRRLLTVEREAAVSEARRLQAEVAESLK